MPKNNPTYCGFGKAIFLKAPYWSFHKASCKIHDENYAKGGNREDRLRADVGFLKHMLIDISDMPHKKKARATFSACIYYLLVRAFGWMSWEVNNFHKFSNHD